MIFSSTKYRGTFNKSVSVQTNDPDHPKVGLVARGRVLMPMNMSVTRLNFGQVAGYIPPRTKTVTLTSGDGGEIRPEIVPSPKGVYEARLCEVIQGHEYELEVFLNPDRITKNVRENLRVYTGVAEAPEVTLMVTASKAPRLAMTPRQFVFPADRQEAMTRIARLKWDNGKPANILGVSTNLPEAQVTHEERKSGQTVILTVPPGASKAGASTSVTVRTDDPKARSFNIPILIQRRSAGALNAQRARTGASRSSLTTGGVKPVAATPVRAKKKE